MITLFHEHIQKCTGCGLYQNQRPLIDKKTNGDIFWIGLSAVSVMDVGIDTPLSPLSNSGKLIAEIEEQCPQSQFYKSNLVKCLPMKENKIRYPSKSEMSSCFKNLELEFGNIKPKLVFLLGKQVADFVSNRFGVQLGKLSDDFGYAPRLAGNLLIVQIHHPSYILIYRRKIVEEYKRSIINIITNAGNRQ